MEGTSKECVEEILTYITSNDAEVVKDLKNALQENLYSARASTLLDTLIDQYISTKSLRLVEILTGINDSHSIRLFEKLNECLKHGSNFEVGTLLFSVVRKQPSWLHKIVSTPLFATLLKSLKSEMDFIVLLNGIMTLASLLPCVPAIMGPFLGDLFDIFIHGSALLLKPGRMPDVCALHLHVGVYAFFQRYYSMYPNSFMGYMKSFCASGKGDIVFRKIIQPMFEFVKFHPDLILHTPKSECSLEKWKVFQPHDVLAECQKISLDPFESVKEGCQVDLMTEECIHMDDSNPNQSQQQHVQLDASNSSLLRLNSIFSNPEHDQSFSNTSTSTKNEAKSQGKILVYDSESICNPSEICHMTTPPSSQPLSPSNSYHDLASLKQAGYDIDKSDHRGSIQSLNESDRKSLSDSQNFGNRSPFLLHKTGSNENVNHKSLFKSLISSQQSTPVEKDTSRKSTPISPRRSGGHKNPKNRPISSEFLKSRFSNSGQFDHYHSAPSSPMVSTVSGTGSQFSFNNTSEIEDVKTAEEPAKIIHRSIVEYESPIVNKHTGNLVSSLRKLVNESGCKEDSNLESSCPMNIQPRKSPLQILDDYINFGTELHSLLLNRVPLTSQLDTDWSHFGRADGQTTDEQKILQMQVHMLHTQLMYERYKAELHCLRNRRLFSNLQRTHATQTEIDTLKNQLTLTERKLNEVKPTLNARNEEIRSLKSMYSSREKEFNCKISELEESLRILQYKLKNTEATKQKEVDKNKVVQKELHKVKNLLFEATEEISQFQPKMKNIQELHCAVNNLQKQLAVQIQKHEMIRNSVKDFQLKNNADVLLNERLRAIQRSYDFVKDEKDKLSRTVEGLKVQISEFDATIVKKEKLIGEHKKQINFLHEKHKKEIQVLKERFDSCRKTCQSLQSYITSLYSKVEHNEARKSNSSQISWDNHKCGNKCRRSATFDDLDILPSASSHGHRSHEQSHRHSLLHISSSVKSRQSSENPFSRTRVKRFNSLTESEGSSLSDLHGK